MIWLWIILAVAISIIQCCNKKISWIHYIWVLFPVEMYGISISGAIIKPYMLFGIVLIVIQITRFKSIRISKSLLLLLLLVFATDLLNGFATGSVLQHMLFAIVCYTIYAYVLLMKRDDKSLFQISEVVISTLIGYGITFIIGYVLLSSGIDGIFTMDRLKDGLYLGYKEYGGIVSTRLRGFTIDPNASITALIPGFCFALYSLPNERGLKLLRNIIAISIYWIVVMLTFSRMAQIFSFIILILILSMHFYRTAKKGIWILAVLVAFLVVLLNVTVNNKNILDAISNYIIHTYSQRASITDEYGRITIWLTNMRQLFENNRFLFGVGQNQIQYYSSLKLACHNTWLEWICGTGIFVGSTMCIWFLSAPIRALRKIRLINDNSDQLIPYVLSHFTIFLCLIAVDHITNPAFIALTLILHMYANAVLNNHETNIILKRHKGFNNENIG